MRWKRSCNGGTFAIGRTSRGRRSTSRWRNCNDSATVRITRTGRLALNRRLADDDWVQRRDRPLFLTWLALCSTLPTASIVAGIDARTKFLVAQRDRERRTLGSIERDVTVTSCFPKAMVDLAIRQFDVELLWLADLRVAVAGAAR